MDPAVPPDVGEKKGKKRKLESNRKGNEVKNTRRGSRSVTDRKKKSIKESAKAPKVFISDLSRLDLNRTKNAKKPVSQKKIPKVKVPRDPDNPYPGSAPIGKHKLIKYNRGRPLKLNNHRSVVLNGSKKVETKINQVTQRTARTEFIQLEKKGFIEASEDEVTTDLTQNDIASSVDIASAQKFFDLKLDKFGPYRVSYTRNGRFLLVGGGKGHVAAIDWQTKKLMCEVNVMQTCHDVQWLHLEKMFAVAQRQWTYIYDNQGVELHCLKHMNGVLRLEFLPYHFLLVGADETGYLQWLDVSIGKKVAGFHTHEGRLNVMCQNPSNAIIHLGHAKGTVSLWSPNISSPVVKMFCHRGATRSVAVSRDGRFMVTSGSDRTIKVWDIRMYRCLEQNKIATPASHLAISQTGIVAASMGGVVELYQNMFNQQPTYPYLRHRLHGAVSNFEFCPFEDVLGVGYEKGFSSLLVPGAGEPNFDALETNPYQTKKQRNHLEVKMLLEKIQPDVINVDANKIVEVKCRTDEEKFEERARILYGKPNIGKFTPKNKQKGKGKTGRVEIRKNISRTVQQRKHLELVRKVKEGEKKTSVKSNTPKRKKFDALQRFGT